MISRYFQAMSDALERHGGTVEKFIGDAVMAVFGIPTLREDDALRAVRAAAEMRTALEELNEQLERRWGVRLRVRTGVNTGEVIAGDPSQGHGFVTGDAVNVAARLEQAAGAGEILIGEHTFALVRDAARVEPVEPLDLKGKSEPVPAFRLVDVADHAAGLDGRPSLPMVGRERELGLLREAFERTLAERTCELVTVVGPAGIGKSRLADEFADGLGETASVAVGRCLSYGEGLTFWPLREVVEELAGTDDSDSAEEAQAKLARLPEEDDKATVVERVAGALGLSDVAAYPTETAWAVRKLLEAVADQQPLVVLFEDIHWAEPTFLELIKYLAATIRGVPILIVAIARTDLLDAVPDFAGGLDNATRMELQLRTKRPESSALVEHLIGDAAVASDLSQRIFTAGGGNPLFVEELARLLADEPSALGATHHPRPAGGPTRSARSGRARRGRGRRGRREVVWGRGGVRVSGQAATIIRFPDPTAHAALASSDLIQPDGGRFAGEETFSFKHMLVRDVAYQGILKEVRADFHERFADWLERAAGERTGEYEEILGYHLERAYRYLTELGPIDERGRELAARAAARLGSSGRRALARGDIPPAVNLLERAVSLLDDDDPARRDLTLKLGIALAETGQLTRADGLLHDRIQAERRGRTFVVFHDAGGKQHVVDLRDEELTITVGRQADSDVALSWDHDVSRRHAELRRMPEGWTLVDEGSRNGSYLNGQRVSGQHPLREGDVLRFGDTVVLFRAPVSDEDAIPVQPGQVTSLGQRSTHWAGPAEADPER